MKQHGWITWTLCALIGACASQPKQPPRIMMQGFSIAAPSEKEWVIVSQSPEMTVIGKPGRYSGETYAMQATVVKLPHAESADELARNVETTQRKEFDPKLYRLFKFEVIPQNIHGQACALSHVEAAERTRAEGTGSPVNMMLETMTLVCPHPKDPLRAIKLAYTHRHFPEDVDPQFSQDAGALMQNMAFEPL